MEQYKMFIDVLGWIGVALYVIAYYLVSVGRVHGRARSYQYMNLIGAFGVACNAFYYNAYPSAVVNVIWFAIAFATLVNVLQASQESDPGHPEYSEGRGVHRFMFFAGCLLAIFGGGVAVLVISPRPPKPLQQVNVYTGNWEPFVGESLVHDGPIADMARDIFRRAGYEPRMQFMPWNSAEDLIAINEEFAAFPFVDSAQRRDEVLFSDPFYQFDYVLFYHVAGRVDEERLKQWNAGELAAVDWRLGVPAGYDVWPALQAADLETVDFATIQDAFRALDSGEIDFVPESRLVGEHLLLDPVFNVDASRVRAADVTREQLQRGVPCGAEQSLHIIAPPNDSGAALIRELNRAIDTFLGSQDDGSTGVIGGDAERVDPLSTVRSPPTRIEFDGVVEALDERGESYRLARGVRAVVLKWPSAFDDSSAHTEDGRSDETRPRYPSRCRIKVITGPLRGRIMHVQPDSFVVLPREEDR